MRRSTESSSQWSSDPASVQKLSILTGDERILDPSHPVNIATLLENSLERLEDPDKESIPVYHGIDLTGMNAEETNIIHGGTIMSVTALHQGANQMARAILDVLNSRGLAETRNGDGDVIIAVSMSPSEAMVLTLLAVWKVGAAYLPLDAVSKALNRTRHIMGESRPVLIITESDDSEAFGNYNFMTFDELKLSSEQLSTDNVPVESRVSCKAKGERLKDIAVVLYTSGSTGVPKGVRIPHCAVLNHLHWYWNTFPYSETERTCVLKTSITFVDAICELWTPLLWGRSLVVLTRDEYVNPETLLAACDKFQLERLQVVSSHLYAILLYVSTLDDRKSSKQGKEVEPTHRFKSLRLVTCGSEQVPLSLATRFYELFDRNTHVLCNVYGSTENMAFVASHVITTQDTETCDSVPIGKPVFNTNMYILDTSLKPVPDGELGELFVSGLNLAAGYVAGGDSDKFLDNPFSKDSAVHNRLYRTGDIFYIKKDVLYCNGRLDSLMKVRGHRVDMAEVQEALARVEGVNESCVLCHNPGQIDQALLGFFTSTKQMTCQEVEEALSASLVSYMQPQAVRVDTMPLLNNGKVDRLALLKEYKSAGGPDSAIMDYTKIPPDSEEAAKVLFETVAVVLGASLRGAISGNSNFYQLGGNSLNSVLTVTKLRDLGFNIGVGQFISAPTLYDVLTFMKKEDETTRFSVDSIIPLKESHANKYTMEMMKAEHKKDVLKLVSTGFYEKDDLKMWMTATIQLQDYIELLEFLWQPQLNNNLGFVIKDSNSHIVAVAVNFDANDELMVTINSNLSIIIHFLEYLEAPIRKDKLPRGKGKVLHNFMMATELSLSAQENVELMLHLQKELLQLAKSRGFVGVLTTDTNLLTQHISGDLCGYQELLSYQVNKYTSIDGNTPFKRAPDSQKVIVSWKQL